MFYKREKKEVTPKEALLKLMQQCSSAEKSTGDALRLLERWEIDKESAEEIVAKLISDKYIDNKRYASAFVRSKSRLNGWGERKIALALRMKGISQFDIKEALQEITSKESSDTLSRILTKKLSTIKDTDKYKIKDKLIRHALSRGFSLDDVIDAVNKLIKTL